MDRFSIDDGPKLTEVQAAKTRRGPERLVVYRVVVLVLAVLVAALLVTVLMQNRSRHATGDATQECRSATCLQQAVNTISWMNTSVKPCSNFYQHVCGSFNVRNPRGDRSEYGISEKLEDYNRQRLQDLLQERNYTAGTAFNKTATLFQACMNVHDTADVYDLVELINSLGGLEMFGTWSPNRYDFQNTLMKLLGNLRSASIFGLSEDSERKIFMQPTHLSHFYWKQHSLLKSSDDAYDYDRNTTKYDRNLRRNIRTVLQSLPINNTACNHSRCLDQMVDDVLDIDEQLNLLYMSTEEINVTQLEEIMDEIDWKELLNFLYGNHFLKNDTTISIPGMSYIEDVNSLIKNTTQNKMQHFLMWCLIRDSLPLLGDPFASFYNQLAAQDFATDTGVNPRSEYCVSTVRQFMPQVIPVLFLHAHVGLDSQDAAAALFNDTMEVLFNYTNLLNSSLLSRYRNTSMHFGRTNSLDAAASLDAVYEPLRLNYSTHYFNAIRAVQELWRVRLQQELAEDPAEAVLTAAEEVPHDFVTLQYSPLSNTLMVPFGALQPPWFSAQLPQSVNTAALGSMILEEIFRSLVHTEARMSYDTKSELTTAFDQYKFCVNESFSKLEPYTSQQNDGMEPLYYSARSHDALYEHFALKSSWKLYNRLKSNATYLPCLSSASPHQLFFTAFAQARCENNGPRYNSPRDRRHSIENIINNLMFNDNAFKKAFACDEVPLKYDDKNQCELE